MEKGESSGLPAGGEDYSQATQKLVAFLTSFEEDGLDDVERKYVTKLQEVANRLTRVVEVCLDDVEANLGDEMAERVARAEERVLLVALGVDLCVEDASRTPDRHIQRRHLHVSRAVQDEDQQGHGYRGSLHIDLLSHARSRKYHKSGTVKRG